MVEYTTIVRALGNGARKVLVRTMRLRRPALGLSQEEFGHRAEMDRTYLIPMEWWVYARPSTWSGA